MQRVHRIQAKSVSHLNYPTINFAIQGTKSQFFGQGTIAMDAAATICVIMVHSEGKLHKVKEFAPN